MRLNCDNLRWTGMLVVACLLAAPITGCGKGKGLGFAANKSEKGADLAGSLAVPGGELPDEQVTPGVYKGNLTPEKAAEITNAVAKLSLAEIPTKDLPKDPKVMMEINERIRQKSETLYTRYGTTMGDVMRYISDLSPKDRDLYNNRLTELFLQDGKNRPDTGSGTRPAAGQKP
jgi:hypothetical protein